MGRPRDSDLSPSTMTYAAVTGTLVAGLGLAWLAWHGVFKRVEWREEQLEELQVFFVCHKGDYKNISDAFNRLVSELRTAGLANLKFCNSEHRFVGIFLDDPMSKPMAEWRSCAGIVVPPNDTDLLTAASACGLSSMKVKGQHGLACHFPLVSSWSFMFGVMKVFPALRKKCEQDGGRHHDAILEVYDYKRRDILYFAGQVKDDVYE